MISIISDIIELRLYVVFDGWYVMYDSDISPHTEVLCMV